MQGSASNTSENCYIMETVKHYDVPAPVMTLSNPSLNIRIQNNHSSSPIHSWTAMPLNLSVNTIKKQKYVVPLFCLTLLKFNEILLIHNSHRDKAGTNAKKSGLTGHRASLRMLVSNPKHGKFRELYI